MSIEEGIVVSVFSQRNAVRVKRIESGNTISAELKVVKRQDDWFPKLNEKVLCIYKGNRGYVVGSII